MPILRPVPARRLWTIAGVLAVGVVATITAGIIHELTASAGEVNALFDLDGERNWPAGWSSLLLVAGVLAALWAYRASTLGWPALAMAVLLSLAAVDEWTEFHERIRTWTTAVPWQWFYAPLLLLGAVAVLQTIRRRDVPFEAKVLLLGGTASWVVAQAIELVQWSNTEIRVDSPVLVVFEELFEMTGSALIALALCAVALDARDRISA